ncbi:MAG: peroxiredoxin [Alphaproteobacteria bacterium]|nr:MAG: peroxiredoxin [Alphaproteobacteria bacterium]
MRSFIRLIIVCAVCLSLGAPAIAAEMPKVGSRAPAFTLQDQSEHAVSLKMFRGKWVVLYFYPQDTSPGCSLQAHNFQRDMLRYTEKNASVVGISVDSPAAHRKFCADEELTLTLLSDQKNTVMDLYGSLMKEGPIKLANRNTFIIDPKGVIRKIYTNVKPVRHSAEVLSDLEKLQSQSQ